MAKIPGYEDRVTAGGSLDVRANPDSFGAPAGRALEGAADTLSQAIETQDVTNAHVTMAKARAEWTKNLQERQNQADPGDENFAPKLMEDMGDWFSKGSDSATTGRGKQVYSTLAANMVSEFGQQAVRIQGDMAAQDALNKYGDLQKNLGSAVYQDPSQLPSALAQGVAAIDDPKGQYRHIKQTDRDGLKQKLEADLKFSVGEAMAERDPAGLLGAVSPERFARFRPFDNLIKANTVPGGRLGLSPAATAQAPQVIPAAAAKNLNPNVMLAQRDVEGGPAIGEPKAQAAQLSSLLDEFGSYDKALAAFAMGAPAFTDLLKTFPNTWQAQAPAEVQGYVDQVLTKAGATATGDEMAPVEEPAPAVQAPATTGVPAFMQGLSWQQQQHLMDKSYQVMMAQLGMAERAETLAKRERQDQQDQIMNSELQKIVQPGTYGRFSVAEILKNDTLTWNQKQHMIDYAESHSRELANRAENRTNPGEVRRLMLLIHAADDDPKKAYNLDPVMDSYKRGAIATREMVMLRGEVEQMKDGASAGFQKQVNQARNLVFQGLTQSVWGKAQPDKAIDAAYRFNEDLAQQIAAKRAENKDPRVLLDPSSPEYALKPERLKSYLTGANAMGPGAQGGKPQPPAGIPATKINPANQRTYYWHPDGKYHAQP